MNKIIKEISILILEGYKTDEIANILNLEIEKVRIIKEKIKKIL